MAETSPDPSLLTEQSTQEQEDTLEPPKDVSDQSSSLKDKPTTSDPKDWDEIKQQLEALIKEGSLGQHDSSSVKRFLFISIVVALVAVFAWYVYSTHSEVAGLRGEIKIIQTWMAVKMDKLKNKTLTKVDQVHRKVVSTVKDMSAKETKLLKSIENKLKV
jgi:hypothetical protein